MGHASSWTQFHLGAETEAIRNGVSYGLLNPLQALLAQSPWYLMCAVVLALAYLIGGWRPAVTAVVCLGLLVGSGLWQDAMVTLAASLVATVLVMVLGVVFGVWMGRSDRADRRKPGPSPKSADERGHAASSPLGGDHTGASTARTDCGRTRIWLSASTRRRSLHGLRPWRWNA